MDGGQQVKKEDMSFCQTSGNHILEESAEMWRNSKFLLMFWFFIISYWLNLIIGHRLYQYISLLILIYSRLRRFCNNLIHFFSMSLAKLSAEMRPLFEHLPSFNWIYSSTWESKLNFETTVKNYKNYSCNVT